MLRVDPEGLLALENVTRLMWNFFPPFFLSQKMLCLDIKEHEEPSSCKYFGEEYMSLRSMRFGGCPMQTCEQGRVWSGS